MSIDKNEIQGYSSTGLISFTYKYTFRYRLLLAHNNFTVMVAMLHVIGCGGLENNCVSTLSDTNQ